MTIDNRFLQRLVWQWPVALTLAFGLNGYCAAVGTLSAQQLLSACAQTADDSDTDFSPCDMYLLGFFAGMEMYDSKKPTDPSFQERALKTRAGSQLKSNNPVAWSRYCIPENTPLATVIGHLRAEASTHPASLHAGDVVKKVLHRHYPCPQ